MKTYCGYCKKECGLIVSKGPMDWDIRPGYAPIPLEREVIAVSECHTYVTYDSPKCIHETNTDLIYIEDDYDESYNKL
jgi:hypothetical protein